MIEKAPWDRARVAGIPTDCCKRQSHDVRYEGELTTGLDLSTDVQVGKRESELSPVDGLFDKSEETLWNREFFLRCMAERQTKIRWVIIHVTTPSDEARRESRHTTRAFRVIRFTSISSAPLADMDAYKLNMSCWRKQFNLSPIKDLLFVSMKLDFGCVKSVERLGWSTTFSGSSANAWKMFSSQSPHRLSGHSPWMCLNWEKGAIQAGDWYSFSPCAWQENLTSFEHVYARHQYDESMTFYF